MTRQSEDDLPHHITGQFSNSKATEDRKAILVTVPQRMIKCFFCGETSHWSNRCMAGKERKAEEKKKRLERKELAEQELENAIERKRERDEKEENRKRKEEEERKQQEDENRRELERIDREELEKEVEREREAKKQKEKSEKQEKKISRKEIEDEEKRKMKEEDEMIDKAIAEAQKERLEAGLMGPGPEVEQAGGLTLQEQARNTEALSYDNSEFGFKSSPFPVKNRNSPACNLFPRGGGTYSDTEDLLTASGSLKSYQLAPNRKKRKYGQEKPVENSTDLVEGDGPPKLGTPVGPNRPKLGEPVGGSTATPKLVEKPFISPLNTPNSWEERSPNELLIDLSSPRGESDNTILKQVD